MYCVRVFLLLFVFLSFTLQGQEPVSWSNSIEKISENKYKLIFDAKIEKIRKKKLVSEKEIKDRINQFKKAKKTKKMEIDVNIKLLEKEFIKRSFDLKKILK